MEQAEVFSKDACPFCTRAVKLLTQKGVGITEVKLGRDMPRDTFLSTLTAKIGKAPETVPQIFLDGQHIGGFTELAAHYGVDPASITDADD